jgi:hypothetical protein
VSAAIMTSHHSGLSAIASIASHIHTILKLYSSILTLWISNQDTAKSREQAFS